VTARHWPHGDLGTWTGILWNQVTALCPECWTTEWVSERAAQKIYNGWRSQVTTVPTLLYSVLFYNHIDTVCWVLCLCSLHSLIYLLVVCSGSNRWQVWYIFLQQSVFMFWFLCTLIFSQYDWWKWEEWERVNLRDMCYVNIRWNFF
jgi:hypothetical protein